MALSKAQLKGDATCHPYKNMFRFLQGVCVALFLGQAQRLSGVPACCLATSVMTELQEERSTKKVIKYFPKFRHYSFKIIKITTVVKLVQIIIPTP